MQNTLTSAFPQSQPVVNPALWLPEYLIMRSAFFGCEIQIHLDRAIVRHIHGRCSYICTKLSYSVEITCSDSKHITFLHTNFLPVVYSKIHTLPQEKHAVLAVALF